MIVSTVTLTMNLYMLQEPIFVYISKCKNYVIDIARVVAITHRENEIVFSMDDGTTTVWFDRGEYEHDKWRRHEFGALILHFQYSYPGLL